MGPTKEEDLVRRLTPKFMELIDPSTFMIHLEVHVLTSIDESLIEAEEKCKGRQYAAKKLLDILSRKEKWFEKIIETLRIEEVKLSHVADKFLQIKKEVDADWIKLEQKSRGAESHQSVLCENKTALSTFIFGNCLPKPKDHYKTDGKRDEQNENKHPTVCDSPRNNFGNDKFNDLERKIIRFLRTNTEPQRTLAIAKACGCETRKDINSSLYRLAKKNIIKQCDTRSPTWQMMS